MRRRPMPSGLSAEASRPWRTAFSTRGWMQRNGHGDRQHLGRDPQRHLEPVTEAGLLEQQVALDRAELLGQRRVLAVPAERVAREVGELQQQLARPVGVGAHERRDGAEGVVDEVRRDLGAQGADLGLHQPVALGVELGQLELSRHPRGDLGGGADQAGRAVRRVDLQRPDDRLLDHQRRHDGVPDLAARLVAAEVRARHDPGVALLEHRLGQPSGGRRVMPAGAVPGQQAGVAGEGHRRAPRAGCAGAGRCVPRCRWSAPAAAPATRARRCGAS